MNLFKKRNFWILIITIVFATLFLGILGRFLYIKVSGEVNHISLFDWAKDKRSATIPLESERGTIYDHNGNILAYNRPTYRLYAILDESYSKNSDQPKHVVDTEAVAKALSEHTDIGAKKAKKTLDDAKEKSLFQVEFGKKGKDLTYEQKKEIEDLDIPGIYFFEDDGRYYPNGVFASHIIGFAKLDEDEKDVVGMTGLEKQKNKILKGKDGYIRFMRDSFGEKLLNKQEKVVEPENGMNIYLTLDQRIQTIMEDVLTQVEDKYKPSKLTAIVMDVKTGEILAMGNRPSYNPNQPENIENWFNDAISTPVEPGSTMKIFTWAAAIDSNNYNGDEEFQSGKYSINEQVDVIGDHNDAEGWGMIPFDEGFERSSNVAASRLVWEKMGPETFLDYLHKFDFEEETEIGLPDEEVGNITFNYPSDKLRTGFGQSSTTTPIQLMKAVTSIINDGEMLRPYVIDKIIDSNTGETVEDNERKVVDKPIKPETAKQVRALMDGAVNSDVGTGSHFRLDDYFVMGKTGTAQIPDPDGNGYMNGRNNHMYSFLGVAPKDDPQIAMYVSVTQPEIKDDELGYDPISFVFKHVMNNSLQYLNIEPDIGEDEDEKESLIEFPDVVDEQTNEVKETLKNQNLNVKVIGNGEKVVETNIQAETKISPLQEVILVTDKPKMPDLKGWSKREVIEFAQLLGLELEIKGSGYATEQSIKAKSKLKNEKKLTVNFK